mmetsp:Transcript_38718/g.116314  ORF Transcript_38718/g.116314 Transcript_38718/m.116314 type:complete len:406 (+) Transcript_38718:64-1281(+)
MTWPFLVHLSCISIRFKTPTVRSKHCPKRRCTRNLSQAVKSCVVSSSSLVYLFGLVRALLPQRAPALLNDIPRGPVSRLYGLLHALALNELTQESSDEGISGPVGIHEQFLRERIDVVFRNLAVVRDDGRFRSLGEDDRPLSGFVLLGGGRDLERDLLEIVAESVLLGVRLGLGFVAEEIIGVGEGRGDLIGEEIDDERGREVQAERLSLGDGVIGHPLEGFDRHREEETGDVVKLGRFDDLLGLGSVEVGRLEVVRGGEVGDEGSLTALDEDGAGSRGGRLVLHVMGPDAVGLGAILQGLAEFVALADGTHEGGGARHAGGVEHPLGDADGILGGSAGDVLRVVGVHELLVDGDVLLLGEDGGVELDVVLVEDVLSNLGRDVEEGVAHAHEDSVVLRHDLGLFF